MATPEFTVLCVGAMPEALPASLVATGLACEPAPDLARAREHDAVPLHAASRVALADSATQPGFTQAAFDSAVVVVAQEADAAAETALLRIDSFSVSSLSFAKKISARRRSRRSGSGARAGTARCP